MSNKRKYNQSRLDEIDAHVMAGICEGDDDIGASSSSHDQQSVNNDHQAQDISIVMRSPKYEVEQIVDYKPVPYMFMDWDKVDEEDRAIEGILPHWDVCQLCELDQTDEEKEAWPALENLRTCGDRNGSKMTPIALAKMMRRMYDATVRPGVEGETPMRTRMFWMHIDAHAPTIMHITEDSLRTLTNASRVIRDEELFEEHTGTKRMRVSRGPAMMLLKIEKEKKPYMKAVTEMRAARSIQ